MSNQTFTIAQGSHTGYPAPGGYGVHRYEAEDGCIWEIHYEPERFLVYRRWVPGPVVLEGECTADTKQHSDEASLDAEQRSEEQT